MLCGDTDAGRRTHGMDGCHPLMLAVVLYLLVMITLLVLAAVPACAHVLAKGVHVVDSHGLQQALPQGEG